MDNILPSKYPGTKAVFHTIDFYPLFCWSFKTKALSCQISKQLSGKHSCQSVISTFLKSHFLLIVVFWWIYLLLLGLFLVFICSDDDIYSLYWFISINWFKKQSTWRCSRKKSVLFIFEELPGKLKVFTNWAELFFCWSFEILSAVRAQQIYSATI